MSKFRYLAALAAALVAALPASAALFDPNSFAALQASFPATAGTYNFSTGGTPTLTGPGGTNLTGVVSNGVAVFTFGDINIGSGFTLLATGTRPVALLSQAGMVLNVGSIFSSNGAGGSAIPFNQSPGAIKTGGAGGAGGGKGGDSGNNAATLGQVGSGPGGGSADFFGGGGSFGGKGGKGGGSTPGGNTYGDLAVALEGGSGGGGGIRSSGGGGGGGIGIVANTAINISGSIQVNGGAGAGQANGSGGGSGGAIYLSSLAVTLTGATLQANGGSGGAVGDTSGDGGGGGGGRIRIETTPGGFTNNGSSLTAAGFHDPFDPANPNNAFSGQAGTVDIVSTVASATPEPSTAPLVVCALATLFCVARRKRA